MSFYIYRKGFKTLPKSLIKKYPSLEEYTNTTGRELWKLIFGLRLFPYFPSGLVTYVGAVSKINIISFSIISTIGKIPAMIIEVF